VLDCLLDLAAGDYNFTPQSKMLGEKNGNQSEVGLHDIEFEFVKEKDQENVD
jgi:hypothetical protein